MSEKESEDSNKNSDLEQKAQVQEIPEESKEEKEKSTEELREEECVDHVRQVGVERVPVCGRPGARRRA